MPRYVILTHDFPYLHWDFLLEQGNVLRAWRLDSSPDTSGAIDAQALPDHRPIYLDYEGPVSDNRGTVSRFDSGTYEIVRDLPGSLVVRFLGKRGSGTASLRSSRDSVAWLFTRDAPSSKT